jgi:hypothetical protein
MIPIPSAFLHAGRRELLPKVVLLVIGEGLLAKPILTAN